MSCAAHDMSESKPLKFFCMFWICLLIIFISRWDVGALKVGGKGSCRLAGTVVSSCQKPVDHPSRLIRLITCKGTASYFEKWAEKEIKYSPGDENIPLWPKNNWVFSHRWKVTFTLMQNKFLDLNDLFLSIYICFLRKSGCLSSPPGETITKC